MFFLYHKKTRPTGKVLAKALGFQRFGFTVTGRPDFLIRWGNAMPIVVREGREINSARGISLASDKLRAFQKFKEADVKIPWFSSSLEDALAQWRAGKTIFGRTRSGSKGRGIVVYQGQVDQRYDASRPERHELYTEYIPNTREYRLHVVGERVIRTQRKYLEGREAKENEYVKNHAAGYVFKQPRTQLKPDREQLAVAAIKALGLDFGAVDLVIDREGVAYVLEVNTAPACSPLTAQAYVSAFAELVRERSNGDYVLATNFAELEGLRPEGEAVDVRARIFANG